MIQKCPKCGTWCTARERSITNRALEGYAKVIETCAETGKKTSGVTGKILSGIFDVSRASIKAGTDILLGDTYKFVCSKCQHEWSTDNFLSDEEEVLKNEVSNLLEEVWKHGNSTQEEKNDYIQSLKSELCKVPSTVDMRINAHLNAGLAFSYFFLFEDLSKSKYYMDEALKLTPDDHSLIALKGFISREETASDCYEKLQQLIHYKKDEDSCLILTKDKYQNKIEEVLEKYSAKFLELPLMQRRFLVIDSKLNYLPDSFKVIPSYYVPKNMVFPSGHPCERTLYICHPFRHDYYLPFEEFQLALFNDEINEYIEFLQALGAASIEIEETRNSEKSDADKNKFEASVGGKYEVEGGKVEGAFSSEREHFEELKRKYRHIEKSTIVSYPYVPDGLLWYKYRPEWQRLERKRMNGTEEFEEVLSTKEYTACIQNNMQQISLDFNTLIAAANVNGKHEEEKNFSLNENYELKIKVKFHPLSSYQYAAKVNVPKLKKKRDKKKPLFLMWLTVGIIAVITIMTIIFTLIV